ncbi:MAG TPA: hypothetical protein VMH30_06905 [Verrucomicrobiae bacterium]|nr:hypothetical protein [Verrucomicrobiae bacterium]
MSWNTIQTADVLTEFTPAEEAALNNIQGAATELSAILAKVVAKMRSQIKAGGNQLDMTGPTIPDNLQEEAVVMARWRWLNSFPALKALKTKERQDANDAAQKVMKEISSNKPDRPRTELPAIPDTSPSPVNAIQVAGRQRRHATERKLRGLI